MSGAPLLNWHAVIVADAKVRNYLLDASHPSNGGKAAFFNAFGFSLQNWTDLRDALKVHPGLHLVVNVRPNPYGAIYEVRCGLPSPDGRNPCVRSFWVIDPLNANPRLVTAYAYP
jgi:hypothetical protein